MALLAAFSSQEKSSNMNHKFAFTLKPKNYNNWKTMIQPFLETNNMMGYIDGTISCPAQTIAIPATGTGENARPATTQLNPNYKTWLHNDAHIRSLLISTVSEESFSYVKGSTSKELWDNLERGHAPHTQSREFTLKSLLMRIEMKGDEEPVAYINRATEYAADLANIGKPLEDSDLVMMILTGLREEYNGLKSNLLGRPTPVTLADLPALLADHDFMIRKHQTAITSPSMAFTAAANHHSTQPAAPNHAAPPHNLHPITF